MFVIKRNEEKVAFDINKIRNAISKAFAAVNGKQQDDGILDMLALRTVAQAQKKADADGNLHVEDIQDAAEHILAEAGYLDVAKAYILYRESHRKIRSISQDVKAFSKNLVEGGMGPADLDVTEMHDPYNESGDPCEALDVIKNQNASIGSGTVGSMILQSSEALVKMAWESYYPESVKRLSQIDGGDGSMYIHDMGFMGGYCFSGETRIITPDGTNPTFKELVDANVTELDVLAYDRNSNQVVTAKAINPRITRRVNDMVLVRLENMEKAECTPDHPFMTRNGEFVAAKDLQPGDLLMPLNAYSPEKDYQVYAVDLIHNLEPVEVYDLTVPGYENFALAYMNVFVHNCAGWSLKDLIMRGISGVPNKVSSSPAQHLSTLCNQMVNFLGILQNEWAGAQAFSSFDTYLAPFVKADNLDYKQTKQCIQSFVYGVNVSSRWGSQAPFSNVTLDWTIPQDMRNMPALVGGKEMDFTYGECEKEAAMINRAFIEVMIEGDCNGRGFAYPIPTYSITKNFRWDDKNLFDWNDENTFGTHSKGTSNNQLLFEMATKYGTPYFSNYINSDMNPEDIRSMCCRLRLDLRELRKQNGGNFGAGENTGSIGVVTINLPHIAYMADTEEEFFKRLKEVMDAAALSLDIKRRVCTAYLERPNSAYPYTKAYLDAGYRNHFSTIGVVGMNEACLNAKWLRKDLTNAECIRWANKVLDWMRERLSDYQEVYWADREHTTHALFNLEATPAESTCYTLARMDKRRFPDIITAGSNGSPYYTNSTHLPVGNTDDVFSALDKEDELQTKYTSGTVFHCFLGERLPSWESAAALVRKIAENYRLPYFTLSPTYSVCPDHGYIVGEKAVCPKCGRVTEVYSRITGYYRPVANWNNGKAQEFSERKTYVIKQGTYRPVLPENAMPDGTPIIPVGIEPEKAENDEQKGIILLSTSTCTKCAMVARMFDERGVKYTRLNADTDAEGEALARKLNVTNVPVLIDGDEVIYDFGQILARVRS